MLLGTIATIILGNALTGKRVIETGQNLYCHLIL